MLLRILLFWLSVVTLIVTAKPVEDFLPKQQNYLENIPTPEQVLGFELGQRHARHFEINGYFETLASSSSRITLSEIGTTYQHRPQVLATISMPENLTNLDKLLANRQLPYKKQENEPLIIWLSYGVHGDELTGTNAAMAVAYHLVASQSKEIQSLLAETIIVIEPSLNPDGLDRFVNWVDTFRRTTPNADPAHIEHHQGWPTGRTNHFWFDLNRDWLLLSQQETRNRLAFYHLYQPHVLSDFHEMHPNQTYFFQPGIASRVHPLTPKNNVELTHKMADFHAKTLDQHNRLYFSQEGYDDFFFGKGSTYPDVNAGVGILFEQASSRGFVIDTINGILTFEKGIENNVLTSLSTIEGAWFNRQALKEYRFNFYKDVKKLAKNDDFDGYLLHEADDQYRLNALLDNLTQHQIKLFALIDDFKYKNKLYQKGNTYYVPLNQPQYRLIKALFNQRTEFEDTGFYDVSGWTLPLAMNIEFHAIEKTRGLKLASESGYQKIVQQQQKIQNSYAYAFQWQDYLAPKLLQTLLSKNIKVKVATSSFTAVVQGQNKTFKQGTILVPSATQISQSWLENLYAAANENNLPLFALDSGLTAQGADLGSRLMMPINPINVLLIGGKGVSEYEAGEMLYYLDHTLNIPITLVEKERLLSVNLEQYSHVIMVDGNYQSFGDNHINKIKSFMSAGGVVFSQKRGAKWLANHRLLKARFATKNAIFSMFNDDDLPYQEKERLIDKRKVSGAIFEAKLDLSHPLTYGYASETLPVFRNSTLIIEKTNIPFSEVISYSRDPLLSGYADKLIIDRLESEALFVAHNVGKGRVIATSDNLLFRGYWLGTAKLVANSLYFSKVFSTHTN